MGKPLSKSGNLELSTPLSNPVLDNNNQAKMKGNKQHHQVQQTYAAEQTAAPAAPVGPPQMITQVSQHRVANINAMMAENLSPVRASDFQAFLPPVQEHLAGRPLLVLDLDETLVHSSFKPVTVPDLVIPVEIKGNTHQVYVRKRPYVDEFMRRMAQMFEVVVFTASLAEYADPLLDELDPEGTLIHHRLFREHCSNTNGLFVKDLSLLGRSLQRIIIIDNSPTSFLFQPRNSIQCTSWFDDVGDSELADLLPVMEDLAMCTNVYHVLDEFRMQMSAGQGLMSLQNYQSIHQTSVAADGSTQQQDESQCHAAAHSPAASSQIAVTVAGPM